MEQPVKIVNTVSENQKVCAYKKAMRMICEIARDHYDESFPCLERVIEEYSELEMVFYFFNYIILKLKFLVVFLI